MPKVQELIGRLECLREQRRRCARGGEIEEERDLLRVEVQLLRSWIDLDRDEAAEWARRAWQAVCVADSALRRAEEAEAMVEVAMTVGLAACDDAQSSAVASRIAR